MTRLNRAVCVKHLAVELDHPLPKAHRCEGSGGHARTTRVSGECPTESLGHEFGASAVLGKQGEVDGEAADVQEGGKGEQECCACERLGRQGCNARASTPPPKESQK